MALLQISKARDAAERVGWTFVQAYIGLGALSWLADGVNLSLLHQLYAALGAALAATVKVTLAQRFGGRGSGDAIPGGIVKATPPALVPPVSSSPTTVAAPPPPTPAETPPPVQPTP